MNTVMKMMKENFSGGTQKMPKEPWIGPNVPETMTAQRKENLPPIRGEKSTPEKLAEEGGGFSPGNRYATATVQSFTNFKEIGSGRNALIYSAICKATGQRVAIKAYLRKGLTAIDLYRVKREISLLRMLRHEHIIGWLGHFENEQSVFLVQEWAARSDLFEELRLCGGSMTERRAVSQVLLPLIGALQYMHSQGVLHRDLKPENILLTADGTIKVCDFGLAINVALERPASRLGTLQYMAPEVVCRPLVRPRNMAAIEAYDERVDIWACGVLVYELVMGRPPFEASTDEGTTEQIMHMELSNMPECMSVLCQDFIRKVLRKQPSERLTLAEMLRHPFITANVSYEQLQRVRRSATTISPRASKTAIRTPSPVKVTKSALWEFEGPESPALLSATGKVIPKTTQGKNLASLTAEGEGRGGDRIRVGALREGTEQKGGDLAQGKHEAGGKKLLDGHIETEKTCNNLQNKRAFKSSKVHPFNPDDENGGPALNSESGKSGTQSQEANLCPENDTVGRVPAHVKVCERKQDEEDKGGGLSDNQKRTENGVREMEPGLASLKSQAQGAFASLLRVAMPKSAPEPAKASPSKSIASGLKTDFERADTDKQATIPAFTLIPVAADGPANKHSETEYSTPKSELSSSHVSSSSAASSSSDSTETAFPPSPPTSPHSPLQLHGSEWLKPRKDASLTSPTTRGTPEHNGSTSRIPVAKHMKVGEGNEDSVMMSPNTKEESSKGISVSSPGRGVPTRPLLPDVQFDKKSVWLMNPKAVSADATANAAADKEKLQIRVLEKGGGKGEGEQQRGKEEGRNSMDKGWPWLTSLLEAVTSP